jgi:hypothetical protein
MRFPKKRDHIRGKTYTAPYAHTSSGDVRQSVEWPGEDPLL